MPEAAVQSRSVAPGQALTARSSAWTGSGVGDGVGLMVGCVGGSDAGPAAWQTVYSNKGLAGAVLSAWGTGPDDVFLVGGPLGDTGLEAVAVHFDGKAWTKLAPGGKR